MNKNEKRREELSDRELLIRIDERVTSHGDRIGRLEKVILGGLIAVVALFKDVVLKKLSS
jgi:hypothetical protein